MSNIDVVARCIEAISRGDTAPLKEFSAPEVEITPLRAVLEDTIYRGHDGIEQWMRDIRETWAELTIEVHDITEPEPGHVVARTTLYGRGHESSVPTQMDVNLEGWFVDGLVVRAVTVVTGA